MNSKSKFVFRSLINRTAEEAFGWHLRPRMIERTLPPGVPIQVISSEGRPDHEGSQVSIHGKVFGPFSQDLIFEYQDFVPT